jgi:hypothetical protein
MPYRVTLVCGCLALLQVAQQEAERSKFVVALSEQEKQVRLVTLLRFVQNGSHGCIAYPMRVGGSHPSRGRIRGRGAHLVSAAREWHWHD